MNRRAIWLENIGTTGFDNADCYLHADTSFRPSGTGMCFDVAVSISGEACCASCVVPRRRFLRILV